MRRSPTVWVVMLWLPMAGCGGSGQNGDPVAVDAFPGRFATAWCGLLQRCCQASGGATNGTCEGDTLARSTNVNSEAAAAGATWDSAGAGRCLSAIAAADCTSADPVALRKLLDDCSDTWVGMTPPGGACQTYEACAKPAVSGGATGGASCVNSICLQVVRQPPGGTCSASSTVTCDPLLATCESGTCVALPGPGQPCTGSCRSGARCTAGTCEALLATGSSCTSASELCQRPLQRGPLRLHLRRRQRLLRAAIGRKPPILESDLPLPQQLAQVGFRICPRETLVEGLVW